MKIRNKLIKIIIFAILLMPLTARAARISINFLSEKAPSIGNYGSEFLPTSIGRNEQLNRGYQELLKLEFDNAIKILTGVAENKNLSAVIRSEAYTYIGYAYLNKERKFWEKEAKDSLEMARQLDPQNALADFFLANIYFIKNDFENTNKYLNSAIDKRDKFIAALRLRAETAKDEHNLEGAANYYRQIIEELPYSGYYHYQYYKVANMMKDYQAVEEVLSKMIEMEPDFVLNKILLGENYINMGRYDEAQKVFEDILQANPEMARANEGLARFYLAKGQYQKALEQVDIIKQKTPSNTYVNALVEEINEERSEELRQKSRIALIVFLVVFGVGGIIYLFILHQRKKYIIKQIREFNKSIDNIYDQESLMVFLVDFFMKLGKARKGAFLLFNRQNNQLSLRELKGYEEDEVDEEFKDFSLFAGGDISNWLSDLKKYRVSIKEIDRKDQFNQIFPSLAERLKQLNLEYVLPLREKNSFVGFVALDSFEAKKKMGHFDEDLLMPLSTLSAQAISTFTLLETAITDETTGLFNKRYFIQNLSVELRRADRYGQPLSLLTFDIDDFKRVNDTFGHPQGDKVLKELGGVIIQTFREGIDISARTGGEEFSVLLPATDDDSAKTAARRLRQAVEKHDFSGFPDDANWQITVSVGVATYPTHASSGKSLI
ncbi:MAG: diguanylate cyclase, partial [Vulcanimicrobiota bacterium]